MTFGEKLYTLRKSSGLSQEQLAEKCSITRQSVSKWELGQGYPETEKLLILCRVLNVDLDYLLRDEISSQSAQGLQSASNPYQAYLGKWTTLLLYDKDFGAIPVAGITAMNDDYVVFNTKEKMGVIKTADIKTISEAEISQKKAATLKEIEVFELKNGESPYRLFLGKNCTVKFKRGDPSSIYNLGGIQASKIIAVTDGNITVLFKSKEMTLKTKDVLVVIEN